MKITTEQFLKLLKESKVTYFNGDLIKEVEHLGKTYWVEFRCIATDSSSTFKYYLRNNLILIIGDHPSILIKLDL